VIETHKKEHVVMLDNIVEVQGLTKEFGKTVAVNNLNFAVQAGEILGLLGANGAGKTTTIHMLLGLITPTRGSISIFGDQMNLSRIQILARMNFASAYQALPYNLKVWENLFVFAEIYGIANVRTKIGELLEMFELSHLRNALTGTLSSGEQTRLTLCKALLNDPRLLLLDEPTASLDPDLADKVRKILLAKQKETGMTLINTSHNMLDVTEMCDRILFMQKGMIVAEGTSQQILHRYSSKTMEEAFIAISRTKDVEGRDQPIQQGA
jgi:ABC-2 type transport system ATP-binding protein